MRIYLVFCHHQRPLVLTCRSITEQRDQRHSHTYGLSQTKNNLEQPAPSHPGHFKSRESNLQRWAAEPQWCNDSSFLFSGKVHVWLKHAQASVCRYEITRLQLQDNPLQHEISGALRCLFSPSNEYRALQCPMTGSGSSSSNSSSNSCGSGLGCPGCGGLVRCWGVWCSWLVSSV